MLKGQDEQMPCRLLSAAVFASGLCLVVAVSLHADEKKSLNAAQKKELAAIRTELNRIRMPIRHDSIDDADKKTTEAETRLESLVGEAALADDDPHIAPLRKLIAARRRAITKAREKEEERPSGKTESASVKGSAKGKGGAKPKPTNKPISFVSDIAPIFVKHCLSCHGKDAKGGLRL